MIPAQRSKDPDVLKVPQSEVIQHLKDQDPPGTKLTVITQLHHGNLNKLPALLRKLTEDNGNYTVILTKD
jgi:hypothetical protein